MARISQSTREGSWVKKLHSAAAVSEDSKETSFATAKEKGQQKMLTMATASSGHRKETHGKWTAEGRLASGLLRKQWSILQNPWDGITPPGGFYFL